MYKILVGVASVSAGLVFYYLSQETIIAAPTSQLEQKQTILAILDELSISLTKAYTSIALFSLSLKQNSSEKISAESLSETILSNYNISKELKLAEEKVFDRFFTNEEEFNQIVYNKFGSDEEIQKKLVKMKKCLSNACLGFVIEEAAEIPYDLSPFIVLQITEEFFDIELYLAYKQNEYKSSVPKSIYDSDDEFDEICFEIEMEKNLCKASVFKKHGIFVSEIEANRFLRSATRNFRIVDENFKLRHSELEQKYNATVSQIFDKTIPTEDFEKIKKIYYEHCY